MKPLSATLLLGTLFLSACSEGPAEQKKLEARPTKLFTVDVAQDLRTVRLPATIEASEQTVMGFQVSGLLAKLDLGEGTEVKRGQVLATLDQRDFRNALVSAQAAFDIAQTEFDRAERLVAQQALAKSVLDQRRAQRDTTKAALDIARKQLSDTILRAPFDGIIADIQAEAFETISPQQPVLTLSTYGKADAVVQIPATIMINSDLVRPTNVTIQLDAAPGIRMDATLREGVAVADPGTQTFEVRYSFTPPTDLVVLPGMTGVLSGELAYSPSPSELTISAPAAAIVSESGQAFVWVVDSETMTVNRRDVEAGPGRDAFVTIVDGLNRGETIVSAGAPYLYEGAKIRTFSSKG